MLYSPANGLRHSTENSTTPCKTFLSLIQIPKNPQNPSTQMQPIEPHFTAIDDVKVMKSCAAHNSAACISSYPRILLKQCKGHQRTKENDQVGIRSTSPETSPEKGFSGHRRLAVGQSVEVFWEGCWKRGKITGVNKGFKYLVVMEGREEVNVEVCGSHVRVCRDWSDGSWTPPLDSLQLPKKSWLIDERSERMQLKIEQKRNLLANTEPGTIADVRSNVNGKQVKFRVKYGKKDFETKFRPGTTVEVRSNEDGYLGCWYAATVVRSAGVGKFLVEYKNLKTDDESDLLRDVANEEDIRPCPPEIPQSHRYEVLQEVDARQNSGWWKGVISEVLDECKYIVYFASTCQKSVYSHSHLRPHQNWVCGKWVLALQKESCQIKGERSDRMQLKPEQGGSFHRIHRIPKPVTKAAIRSNGNPKGLKLRIRYPQPTLETNFSPGTMVEVRSDEDGYQGSWYTATVIGSAGVGKFLVEYKTLMSDDKTTFLREVASEQDIRPYPPGIPQGQRYRVLQEVDAWYNDGWWEGVIAEVLGEWKYSVYFASTNEKLAFQHAHLRPHQNLFHGKWVLPSLVEIASWRMKKVKLTSSNTDLTIWKYWGINGSILKSQPLLVQIKARQSDLKLKAMPSKRKYIQKKSDGKFQKGALVEVRSDEQGYERTWYSAVIVRSKGNGRFLVEYCTLKTDDKREFLREETDAQNIRPGPPLKVDNHYRLLEKVDAWYNGGWREGLISEVSTVGKYMVFFGMTGEETEFDHADLRKHQEWIDGKWVGPDKEDCG